MNLFLNTHNRTSAPITVKTIQPSTTVPRTRTSAVSVGPVTAATLKFGSVSQTLSSLTIGAGSTVTFTGGLASFSGGSRGKAPSFGGTAVVPEPGALGVLNRRRQP